MVTYRKCWTLMGHSNGEGVAGQSPLIEANPHWIQLGTRTSAGVAALAANRKFPGLKMYVTSNAWPSPWPWLNVLQSSPFTGYSPDQGDDRPTNAIGTGAWLDLTLDYATSPGDQTHPYYDASLSPNPPYMVPSGRSIPFPPDEYRADGTGAGGLLRDAGGGAVTGIELPLSYSLAAHWGENPYGVKLSIPSSYLMRKENGFEGYATYYGKRGTAVSPWDSTKYYYAWLSPFENFDWDPTSGRLYDSMVAKMTGAAAALPAGEQLDVRLSVMWMGDNDAGISGATPRIVDFKPVYQSLVKAWREKLVAESWTTLPVEQIPIILMGIYKAYGPTPIQDEMNGVMQEMEAEDPYIRFVPTRDYESQEEAGYSDASHLSHNGYVEATADIMAALREMEMEPLDAMDVDDLVTVSEVKNRVRTYYENNRVRTGATSDDTLLQHINGSLTHIHNRIADRAYWLRKREDIAVTAAVGDVMELDAKIHRVLLIEQTQDATQRLRFQEIGRGNGGKLQIQLMDRGAGTYTFNYIEIPKELTQDAQKVPLPRVALEWLVVETCRRIARATQNVQLQLQLQAEAETLHIDVMRHAAAMTRARNERLRVQRNLRGRVGTHYGRFYPWRTR